MRGVLGESSSSAPKHCPQSEVQCTPTNFIVVRSIATRLLWDQLYLKNSIATMYNCKKWCSATRRRDNDRGPGREKSSIDNVVLEKKWVHYKAKQFYVLAMLLKRIDLQADSLFIFWPTVGMLESNRILWGRGSKSLSFCSQIMTCAREELVAGMNRKEMNCVWR